MAKAYPTPGPHDLSKYYNYRFMINPERMTLFDNAHEHEECRYLICDFLLMKVFTISFEKALELHSESTWSDFSGLDVFQQQELLLKNRYLMPALDDARNLNGVEVFNSWVYLGHDYLLKPLKEAVDHEFFTDLFLFGFSRRNQFEIPFFLEAVMKENFDSDFYGFKRFILGVVEVHAQIITESTREIINDWIGSVRRSFPKESLRSNELMHAALLIHILEQSGELKFKGNKSAWIKQYASDKGLSGDSLINKVKIYQRDKLKRNQALRKSLPILKEKLSGQTQALALLDSLVASLNSAARTK